MDTAHRRMEIISILSAKGHITMRELAWELDVSRRTIINDVIAHCLLTIRFTQSRARAVGFLLRKITSLMQIHLRRQSLKHFAGCTENQRGKRKKYCSVSFTNTVRTS